MFTGSCVGAEREGIHVTVIPLGLILPRVILAVIHSKSYMCLVGISGRWLWVAEGNNSPRCVEGGFVQQRHLPTGRRRGDKQNCKEQTRLCN